MNESDCMDFIDSQFDEQERSQIEYDDMMAYFESLEREYGLPFGVLA